MENQRLWARPSQSKLQQRSGFLLRKAAAFLVGKGCQAVDRDSRVVYVNGRPAISVRDAKLRAEQAWPAELAGSLTTWWRSLSSGGGLPAAPAVAFWREQAFIVAMGVRSFVSFVDSAVSDDSVAVTTSLLSAVPSALDPACPGPVFSCSCVSFACPRVALWNAQALPNTVGGVIVAWRCDACTVLTCGEPCPGLTWHLFLGTFRKMVASLGRTCVKWLQGWWIMLLAMQYYASTPILTGLRRTGLIGMAGVVENLAGALVSLSVGLAACPKLTLFFLMLVPLLGRWRVCSLGSRSRFSVLPSQCLCC